MTAAMSWSALVDLELQCSANRKDVIDVGAISAIKLVWRT